MVLLRDGGLGGYVLPAAALVAYGRTPVAQLLQRRGLVRERGGCSDHGYRARGCSSLLTGEKVKEGEF